MHYAPIIKEIGRGAKGARPMNRAQAQDLFGAILDNQVPDMELGAILLCLRVKGEDEEELAGFLAALQARTATLAVPEGPRCVVLPTYNGARKQPNLMPLVALLLAAEGVPVLIQGRHDFDSRVSPFELLAALALQPASDTATAAAALAQSRLALLQVDSLCPGLDRLLALRPRLGVRNSGHTLAKLLDPAPGRSVRVVAVTHPEYLVRMQALLAERGGVALLMRGTEGEAYCAPRRLPRLLGFRDGYTEVLREAESYGEDEEASGAGCAVAENANLIRTLLEGRQPLPAPIAIQVECLAKLARA